MVQKSRDAFRTISEVAEWLDVPTHVLRFWESRFSQIKPVKRAGGRRYYRPSDMRVIGGVKTLLHDQGMTIRGVQKLFREEGVKHVSSFSAPLDGETPETDAAPATIEADAAPVTPAAPASASRDATPAPIIDPTDTPATEDAEDEAPITEQAPVFAHSARATAEGMVPARDDGPDDQPEIGTGKAAEATESVSMDEPVGDAATENGPRAEDQSLPFLHGGNAAPEAAIETAEPEEEAQEASAEPPRPSIPPTPDVPDTDPGDDDPAFVGDAGIAARLHFTPPQALAAHRADLLQAAERLKAILDRAE